jgi:hypothetical protein
MDEKQFDLRAGSRRSKGRRCFFHHRQNTVIPLIAGIQEDGVLAKAGKNTVIPAKAGIQEFLPSLRGAKRHGNPCGRLDCHVASLLAMTSVRRYAEIEMRNSKFDLRTGSRLSPGRRCFGDDGKNTVIPAKAGIQELCK